MQVEIGASWCVRRFIICASRTTLAPNGGGGRRAHTHTQLAEDGVAFGGALGWELGGDGGPTPADHVVYSHSIGVMKSLVRREI